VAALSRAHVQALEPDHAPFPQKMVSILVNTNPVVDDCMRDYEEETTRSLRQPIALSLTAGPTGEFTGVDVEHRRVKDTSLESCIVRSVSEIPLPSFTGPDVAYKVELATE